MSWTFAPSEMELTVYADDPYDDPYDYSQYRYSDLKRMAAQRKLRLTGSKSNLSKRLVNHDQKQYVSPISLPLTHLTNGTSPFRLLDLPQDIRVVIYELILLSSRPPRNPSFFEAHLHDGDKTNNKEIAQPPLLKVCRTIRAESVPYFFRLRQWYFGSRPDREIAFLRRLLRWLTRVGPLATSGIRSFMVCLPCGNGMILKTVAEEVNKKLPPQAIIAYVAFTRVLSEVWTVARNLCIARKCQGSVKLLKANGECVYDMPLKMENKVKLPNTTAPSQCRPWKIVVTLMPV